MTRAVFPGSFDPPTNGHINIIERVKNIFSEIHVVIAVNGDKRCLFSADERCSMLRRLTERWSNVSVHLCDTLVVEYAKKNNANVLIRGIRSVSDFSYEFELSVMNQSLNPDIETFFMSPDPRYFVLRSSAIKEIASYGGDVSAMVPDCVARALKEKFKFSAE